MYHRFFLPPEGLWELNFDGSAPSELQLDGSWSNLG